MSGSATTSAVSVNFSPSIDADYIVMGGRRFGGVFTAYIRDSSGANIAQCSITCASADSAGFNMTEQVTLARVACQLKKGDQYSLYIPAAGPGYKSFAFVIYP